MEIDFHIGDRLPRKMVYRFFIMKKELHTERILSFKEETVKRFVMPILIIALLALVLIGCDQDMRSNIVGFLDPLGNNVYNDAGMIPANTANAAAASDQIAGLGTGESKGTLTEEEKIDSSVFGVEVDLSAIDDVDENTTFLAPQPKAAQEKLKNELGEALNSPSQKEQLKEDMKKPASDEQKAAAKGTVDAFNTILTSINTKTGGNADFLDNLKLPEIEDDDELTQGDMLMLQLMTDMVKNTVDTLTELSDDGDLSNFDGGNLSEEDFDKVLGIVDEALFAAQMAEELAGVSSIDFTGSLDLTNLLDGIGGGKNRIQARDDGDDDFDFEEVIPALLGLSKEITAMMGAELEDGAVTINQQRYRTFLTMMSSYRSSLEYAFGFGVEKQHRNTYRFANSEHLDLSSIIKYLFAVIATEHEGYIKDYNKDKADSEKVSSRELIEEFLDKNQVFVTGDLDDDDYDDFELTPIDDVEKIYEGVGGYLEDRDEEGLGKTIKDTLRGITVFIGGDLFDDWIDDFDLKDLFGDED